MTGERRGVAARAGLALLNLLAPGLGLLRIGEGRLAVIFLVGPSALLLLTALFYAAIPTLTFTAYALSAGLLLLTAGIIFLASIILSWRRSTTRPPAPRPWWTRWYAILLALIAVDAACLGLASLTHRFYKPYYIPSEGMAPTLIKGDRLVARMGSLGIPERGDVIILRVGAHDYVKRVAGLPGDTIGMEGGRVVLNGREVPQRQMGTERMSGSFRPAIARVLEEQFPGEAGPHRIYDLEESAYDDFPVQRVAAGRIFVLGDNRDMSADSRVPRARDGVEQAPLEDVRGRVLYLTWGRHGRRGIQVSRER